MPGVVPGGPYRANDEKAPSIAVSDWCIGALYDDGRPHPALLHHSHLRTIHYYKYISYSKRIILFIVMQYKLNILRNKKYYYSKYIRSIG